MTVFSQQALKVRKMKQITEQKQILNKGKIADCTKVVGSQGQALVDLFSSNFDNSSPVLDNAKPA